ncbi:hypothetical protein B0H15DRAFT_942221 [Mycena belliarum]|uniref:Uncharacterized protein n=1 Tax=Mycena belliarum TaxID=1033014 RepID=A0AAD6UQE4_9AGAR|nr:hypothetical protein B0H15DRAFT_942221 [Mycena belliae]
MSLEEDPLAAALSHAFTSAPSLLPEPQNQSDAAESTSTPTPSTSTNESSVSSESVDSTSQSEYESHVESWRAQSAEARQKAEKERARWEAIRAAEKQEAALRKAALPEATRDAVGGETSDHGWENVDGSTQEVPRPSSPSPADGRDLVTGEPQGHIVAKETAETAPISQSAPDTGDESQKWEDVSSPLTSSFPSMSFPDRTNTPSPPPPPPAALESATLAIFDGSLSTRTRVTALFSSLAINLLLPFVNGVMLGFGEIFAKNIVLEYFGWRPVAPPPGTVAASVGFGAASRRTKTSVDHPK